MKLLMFEMCYFFLFSGKAYAMGMHQLVVAPRVSY